jgi:fused signal recognition particle receptor
VTFLAGVSARLREGLRRSQEYLASGLGAVLEAERPIDETFYAELEELLIAADLGAALAGDFTNRAREEVMFGTVTRANQLRPLFRRFLLDTLAAAAQPLSLDHRPAVVLMLGVNGSGKTTTSAKLAAALKASGKHVLLAAADTFRAAAIEQLQRWGERIGVEVIHQTAGSDPAAVVFDAVKAATARGADALIVDTAGRLHTKTNLMEELAKLKRVIERQMPGAPHESLVVLEAPTGQNGFAQARMFHERRADQARRHGQGRDRGADRPRAQDPHQADRRRGARRGSPGVRARGLRRRAGARGMKPRVPTAGHAPMTPAPRPPLQ